MVSSRLELSNFESSIVHIAGREVKVILHLKLAGKFSPYVTVDERKCTSIELNLCRYSGFDALPITENQSLVGYFEECHI